MNYRPGSYRIGGSRAWRMAAVAAVIAGLVVATPLMFTFYAMLGITQACLTLGWLAMKLIGENWNETTDR